MEENISYLISLSLLLFCSGGLVSLIIFKIIYPDRSGFRQNLVYGISLFVCALCSYLYTTRASVLPIALLRQFDHAAIFLLIAGTYTPFATGMIYGPFRIRLLYWIWGFALSGVFLRLLISSGYDDLFLAFYLITGWLFVIALPDIVRRVPRGSLFFLGTGALIYSFGAILFATDMGGIWTVSIWHIFVLTAVILHYLAVVGLNNNNLVKA